MPKYDVDTIEEKYEEFLECKKSFFNGEYSDFKNCYLYSSSDSIIVKLRNKISKLYENIDIGYKTIDKVWKQYIQDIKNFDRAASGLGGSASSSQLQGCISKLNNIDLAYTKVGAGTVIKSLGSHANITSGFDEFFDNPAEFLLKHYIKTKCSIINTWMAIGFGALKFLESLFDAVIMLQTLKTIPFAISGAIIKGAVTGEFSWDLVKQAVKTHVNNGMRLASIDGVGMLKESVYSTKIGSFINDNSYKWCKEGGPIYKAGEAIGEVGGNILFGIATGGAGPAVRIITSATCGLTKFAQAGTKEYREKAYDSEGNFIGELDGKQLAALYARAGAKGAVEGTAWYFTYGNGLKTASASNLAPTGFMKNHAFIESVTKAGLQGAKTFAVDGIEATRYDKEFDLAQTTQNAAIASTVSLAFDGINNIDKIAGFANKFTTTGSKVNQTLTKINTGAPTIKKFIEKNTMNSKQPTNINTNQATDITSAISVDNIAPAKSNVFTAIDDTWNQVIKKDAGNKIAGTVVKKPVENILKEVA